MNGSYSFKKKGAHPIIKKTTFLFKVAVIFFVKILEYIYQFFFAKRTIVFVSDHKIRTINIGLFSQFALLSLLIFSGYIFNQSLRHQEIMMQKSRQLKQLKSVNNYFQKEVDHINAQIKTVNDYLISVTGNNPVLKDKRFEPPENIHKDELSQSNQETLEQIKQATLNLRKTQAIVAARITDIETALSRTGLNPHHRITANKSQTPEISLNNKEEVSKAQGGPFIPENTRNKLTEVAQENNIEKSLKKAQFANNFDRLFVLEKLVKSMPLSRPMKNYYISSGFGSRADPIHNRIGVHKGLDFVGALFSKIYSSASGKVILAKRFGHYGKTIIIDHGFGIRTRYGHLASIKVKEGQIVKKGQVIATQGSTGRSTGQHLHYEVRYKGTPLNPKNFIEAGDFLIKDNNV